MNQALTLLAIGMITVFVILTLVVLVGNLLIKVVNRLTPDAGIEISPEKLAAITAAVEVVTDGKGKVSHIEKH